MNSGVITAEGAKQAIKSNEGRFGKVYSRRKRAPYFPDEIIILILNLIPADVLYSCMRYVTKQCFEIIRSPLFMAQHRLSRTGLFLTREDCGYFTSLENPKALTKVEFPHRYKVWGSCGGLLLLEQETDRTMHMANPLSRRITNVPPFWVRLFRHKLSFLCIRATGEYKVVLTNYSCSRRTYECAVLTLGIGCVWKLIQSQMLSDYLSVVTSTYCSGGFIYWVQRDAPYIVCLCVESETVYCLPSPRVDRESDQKHYVPGGEFLSLMVLYEDGKLVDIWCLVDPKGAAAWERMYTVDLGVRISDIGDLRIPIAWVDKVVIFRKFLSEGPLLGCNVMTGEITEIGESRYWPAGFYGEFAGSFFNWVALR